MAEVIKAFIKVMRTCTLKDCGRWIPIDYWSVKVCHQLADKEEDINLLENKPNKLLRLPCFKSIMLLVDALKKKNTMAKSFGYLGIKER